MKADRLLNILLHLQAKGRTTSRDLANKLEVSERTIHRDMETLSASGIPVYAERGSTGGWILTEGYRTNLTGMRKEELAALFLVHSTKIMDDLGRKKDFDSAFMKLLASLPPAFQRDAETVRERIHIDGAGWRNAVESLPHLPLLQDAVWECVRVEILYQKKGRGETPKVRSVEPLGLVAKGNQWYIVTRSGKEYRTFRLSNIHEVNLTSEKFERPKKFDLAKYWEQWLEEFKANLPHYKVKVKAKIDSAGKIRHIPYATVHHLGAPINGWCDVTLDLETKDWAIGSLMMMEDDVIVLEPRDLAKAISDRAQKILGVYAKES